jgi:hypothetical protein
MRTTPAAAATGGLAALSPDGQTLALAALDGRLKTFDTGAVTPVKRILLSTCSTLAYLISPALVFYFEAYDGCRLPPSRSPAIIDLLLSFTPEPFPQRQRLRHSQTHTHCPILLPRNASRHS